MNNHYGGDQNKIPHTMSTLLSGSIADERSASSSRDLYLRSTEQYDPFSSAPLKRYSPPRTVVLENPFLGNDTQHRDSTSNKHNASYNSGIPSYAVTRTDNMAVSSRALHSIDDTGGEASKRRMSLSQLNHYHPESPSRFTYSNAYPVSCSQKVEQVENAPNHQNRRRPMNQDEFDGPSQYLSLPLPQEDQSRTQDLPELPTHLDLLEQDVILQRYNDALADCAFHFVAKYQFPIPLERERHPVRSPSDRDWTEWAYLLKRLATKRRIPARVLHANQIKQLVTVLENSIAVRHSMPRDQHNHKRVSKDDRYLLQLVSAGIQVAKILMDSLAMRQLIDLYAETESLIMQRRRHSPVALPDY